MTKLLLLERLPRVRTCACLSLRAGALLTAILSILYAVLALSVGAAAVSEAAGAGGEAPWLYLAAVLASHALGLAVSAVMLVGVLREKAWMIRPWVVVKAVQTGAGLLCLLAGGLLRYTHHDQHSLLLLAADFLGILIGFYMLMVVCGYVRELDEQRAETARLMLDDTWYTPAAPPLP